MPDFIIRPMTPEDVQAVVELQAAYASAFSGAAVLPGEIYLSPAFHGGEDVFCALQGTQRDAQLLAYAPLYMQPVEEVPPGAPYVAWIEIKAVPGLADGEAVKDALGACIAARLAQRCANLSPRPLRLTFEYGTGEAPAAAYILSRGFQPLESIFHLRRDLTAAMPLRASPEGIQLRPWKMESEEEQRAYLAARNACFPEAPIELSNWQYYMTSPMWAAGTMMAAFDGARLVGAVNVYWNADEIAQASPQRPFGYTEDIFVLLAWRGRGVAGSMIVESMRFLQQHGLQEARLAVRALNEDALHLYRALGYELHSESRFYARILQSDEQAAFSWVGAS